MEAVLNEVELASVVVLVVREVAFDGDDGGITRGGIRNLLCRVDLELLPLTVVGIELVDDLNELLQHPHRKGTGATGGVEDFAGMDGVK